MNEHSLCRVDEKQAVCSAAAWSCRISCSSSLETFNSDIYCMICLIWHYLCCFSTIHHRNARSRKWESTELDTFINWQGIFNIVTSLFWLLFVIFILSRVWDKMCHRTLNHHQAWPFKNSHTHIYVCPYIFINYTQSCVDTHSIVERLLAVRQRAL